MLPSAGFIPRQLVQPLPPVQVRMRMVDPKKIDGCRLEGSLLPLPSPVPALRLPPREPSERRG